MSAETIHAADAVDIYAEHGIAAVYRSPTGATADVTVTRRQSAAAAPRRDGSHALSTVQVLGLLKADVPDVAIGAWIEIDPQTVYEIDDIDIERTNALQTICIARRLR